MRAELLDGPRRKAAAVADRAVRLDVADAAHAGDDGGDGGMAQGEAEGDLGAGFHTEYSGIRFAFFMVSEYAIMLLVSVLAVILFFGGWNGVLIPLPPILWFVLKVAFFIYLLYLAMTGKLDSEVNAFANWLKRLFGR